MSERDDIGGVDYEDPFERGKMDWAFFRWVLLAGFLLMVIAFGIFTWAFAHRNPY
ncbi:hypothetical protein [Streptomyces sp. NBC_00203]|uniref:hypothetical protein n=1 Tax=Streptomyces sp. NBC_00203 TaxID=2975680 RepID=UPI003250D9B2